jgi:acetyl esterase/lipase
MTRSKARKSGDLELMEQLKEDIQVLPDGKSHILWIGNRHKATKFVYFLHGGGYIAPATPGHMEWCLQAYILASRHRSMRGGSNNNRSSPDKVAVAVLQYTLTPQARFPAQMCQAASGLAHLLRGGIRPSQLVVGGDSAGGNLVAQLLSHLLHPYPPAERIVLDEPLAGAFLVSPLVSQDMLARSFVDGRPCDMLSEGIFDNPRREMFYEKPSGLFGVLFPNWGLVETQEFRQGKEWALMGDVDEKWLDRMGNIVRKVYVTCGKHEILRDQGIDIAERIRARNADVEVKLEVAEKEAHDFILLEGQRQVAGDATRRMRSWFSSVWS